MIPPLPASTTATRPMGDRAARPRAGGGMSVSLDGGARMVGRSWRQRQARVGRPGRWALWVPILLMVSTGWAQEAPRGWVAYGGGPESIRYSPLAQINRQNVPRLEVAWTFDSGEEGGLQANPIDVDGVVYTPTPKHHVVALDAATGVLRWKFDSHIPLSGANRGVTYWASGDDRRVF